MTAIDRSIATFHKLLATVVPDGQVTISELTQIRDDIKRLRTAEADFNRKVRSLKLDLEMKQKVRELRRLTKTMITRVERFFIRHA